MIQPIDGGPSRIVDWLLIVAGVVLLAALWRMFRS